MTRHRDGRHRAIRTAFPLKPELIRPTLCALLAASAPLMAGEPASAGDLSMWRASTFKFSGQAEAAISVDGCADDELTAVWSSRRQQHGRSAVCLQRFTRQGVAIGGETPVSLWQSGAAIAPAISTGAGAAWVAWQAHGQDGQGAGVIARVFERSPRANIGQAMKGSAEVLVGVGQ
jgi:hypothetical protein